MLTPNVFKVHQVKHKAVILNQNPSREKIYEQTKCKNVAAQVKLPF
jgi:hypothetical protein